MELGQTKELTTEYLLRPAPSRGARVVSVHPDFNVDNDPLPPVKEYTTLMQYWHSRDPFQTGHRFRWKLWKLAMDLGVVEPVSWLNDKGALNCCGVDQSMG